MQSNLKLRYALAPIAAALIAVACSETARQPVAPEGGSLTPSIPSFTASVAGNGPGKCLKGDVIDYYGAGPVNCTANDISIALTQANSYSLTGAPGSFVALGPGQAINCTEGQHIFVNTTALLSNSAQERYDIGVWINLGLTAADTSALNGVNCNHYNVLNSSAGASDLDLDQCGDMLQGDTAVVPLDVLELVCTDPDGNDSLEVKGCVAWDNSNTGQAADHACPVTDNPQNLAGSHPTSREGFVWGTLPNTPSKCNCEPFRIAINVAKTAKLEVRKVCSPTTDNGTFDLNIDGSNQFANNVACGGTTGSQTVGAGTSQSPGATHTFGESDFTSANYTTTFACVNRSGGSAHAPASGSSLGPNNITLLPDEDVICTYTNTRKPGKLELIKSLSPTNDPGKFNLFIRAGSSGGSIVDSATDVGNNGTTGSGGTTLAIGNYFVGEAAGTGTSAGNYTTTGPACVVRGTATPVSSPGGVVTLASNDDVVCTITNTRQTGKIELIKALVPTGDPGKFNLFIRAGSSGGSIVDSATDVGNNGTTGAGGTTLNTGSYFVGEAAGTGTSIGDYGVTGPACVLRGTATGVASPGGVLSLTNGADVVCTVTNTRNPGKIELIKSLSPTSDPGKFNLFIRAGSSGGAIQDSATDVGNGGTTGAGGTSLPPGSYFVGEAAGTGTAIGDYTVTPVACVVRGTATNVPAPSGIVALASNADVVCTIVNTRNPGKIELIKSLSPTNDPGKFNLFIRLNTSGGAIQDSATDVGNGGTTGAGGTTLPVGNYFVGEAAGTGTTIGDYTVTPVACVVRGTATNVPAPSGIVALASNADVVCTIVNTRNTGKLELKKALVPTNDVGKFNLFIRAGSGAGSIVDSATDVGNNGTTGAGGTTLNTGNYNVSEAAGTNTDLAHYVASAAVCVNRVGGTSVSAPGGTLALVKDADVVCTITNSRKAVLIVDKVAPGVPDLFDFSQTGISNFQLADITTPKKTIDILPGNVTVCELGVFVAWGTTVKVNGGDVTPTVDGTTGDVCYIVALAYGDSTTIEFTNTPPPGGGTRTIGYWKNHASCSRGADGDGKQYTKAIAAGHPEATLDFYLGGSTVPSIYPIGDITTLTCAQAVQLLSKNNINGDKRAGDPIYNMVAQMLGARLNYAAGAGTCPVVDAAFTAAQAFLDGINFTGVAAYKSNSFTQSQLNDINSWGGIFGSYNEGKLPPPCPNHI